MRGSQWLSNSCSVVFFQGAVRGVEEVERGELTHQGPILGLGVESGEFTFSSHSKTLHYVVDALAEDAAFTVSLQVCRVSRICCDL